MTRTWTYRVSACTLCRQRGPSEEGNNVHGRKETDSALPAFDSESADGAADRVSVEQALQFIYGVDGAATHPRVAEYDTEGLVANATLPRSLTGRVPFEVVEHIVDTMQQGNLATCALVCWAWYHAVSRVLYRDIAISHRASLESLVEFIRHDARAFERLQQAHTLRIIASDNLKGQPHNSPPTHVVPLVLGRALPNISRLVFVSSLRPQMHTSFFCTLSVFRGVNTLELLRFRLRSFSELRQVIAAFPGLRVLKLADGFIEPHTTTTPHIAGPSGPPTKTRIRLKQLVLGWDLMPSFLAPLISWLADSSACRDLTHLAIWRWPLNIAPQVDELVGVGETLRVLHEFGPSETSDGLCLQMPDEYLLVLIDCDMAPVGPGLFRQAMYEEKLTVSNLVNGNDHAIQKIHWPDILLDDNNRHCTLVQSPHLRSLQLYLALFDEDDDPNVAIEELHSVLKMVQSSSLQVLKIRQSFELTVKFAPTTKDRVPPSRLFYGAMLSESLAQGLHHTMSASIFDKLTAVEFSFCVNYRGRNFHDAAETASLATMAGEISKGIRHLLIPWHNRGLVEINWTL